MTDAPPYAAPPGGIVGPCEVVTRIVVDVRWDGHRAVERARYDVLRLAADNVLAKLKPGVLHTVRIDLSDGPTSLHEGFYPHRFPGPPQTEVLAVVTVGEVRVEVPRHAPLRMYAPAPIRIVDRPVRSSVRDVSAGELVSVFAGEVRRRATRRPRLLAYRLAGVVRPRWWRLAERAAQLRDAAVRRRARLRREIRLLRLIGLLVIDAVQRDFEDGGG